MPRAFGTSCGLQMEIVILVTSEILAPPAASALVRLTITILAWASKSSGGSTLPSTSAPTWLAQYTRFCAPSAVTTCEYFENGFEMPSGLLLVIFGIAFLSLCLLSLDQRGMDSPMGRSASTRAGCGQWRAALQCEQARILCSSGLRPRIPP